MKPGDDKFWCGVVCVLVLVWKTLVSWCLEERTITHGYVYLVDCA
jgi:hypothetical protein